MSHIENSCNICLEEIDLNNQEEFVKPLCQSSSRTSCSSIFHRSCLREWLTRNQTCPICRTSFIDRISNFPFLITEPRNTIRNYTSLQEYILEDSFTEPIDSVALLRLLDINRIRIRNIGTNFKLTEIPDNLR